MPWITVQVPIDRVSEGTLAVSVCTAAATACGLAPHDFIVHVVSAVAAGSDGAVVTVVGRDRGADIEDALATAMRSTVGAALGADPGLVAVVRTLG